MAVIIIKVLDSGRVEVESACRISDSSHVWMGGRTIDTRNPSCHKKKHVAARLPAPPLPVCLPLPSLGLPRAPPPAAAAESAPTRFPLNNVRSDDGFDLIDRLFYEEGPYSLTEGAALAEPRGAATLA
jgi:hypothetical protein